MKTKWHFATALVLMISLIVSMGTTFDFTAPGSGALFLSVSDWSFKDNLGEFTVTVTVK